MHEWHEPVSAILHECADTILLRHFRNLADGQIFEKTPGDLVTIADRESERFLAERLGALCPEASIVGEEDCAADPAHIERVSDPLCWIIDPIDGTSNYAAGRAPFGILLALAHDGETQAGWIYDPLRRRLCHAVHGKGAWIDGKRFHARESGEPKPVAALHTGFMDEAERGKIECAARENYRIVPTPMCAAEQYPLIAQGEHDVTIFKRTLPWDHASGALFLNEAGGKAARFDGTPYQPWQSDMGGMLATASPRLWDKAAALFA